MAGEPDYYAILSVPKDASAAEIKHAYLELAKQQHPDRNQGTTLLGTHFQQLSKAYAVLSNPEQRAAYDLQQRGAPQRGQRQRLDPNRVPPGFVATEPPKSRPPQPMPAATTAPPRDTSPMLAQATWLSRHAGPVVWMLVGMNMTLLAVVGVLVAVVFVH